MGNVPSPKQQQQFEEALANATEAKDVSPSTSDDDDDVVDPVVTNRMLSRVFIFAGLPVLFGLLLYPGFWYLKVRALHRTVLAYSLSAAKGNADQIMTLVLHAGSAKGRLAYGVGFRDTIDYIRGRATWHFLWCYVSKLGPI